MDQETRAELVALYGEHQHYLYRKAILFFGNHAMAQDIVQEVFLRVIAQLEDGNRRVLDKGYLIKMATNLCIDRLRSKKIRNEYSREQLDQLSQWNPDLGAGLLLREVVQSVPRKLQEIAVYFLVDGFTQDEIVALCGVSKRTLQRQIQRIKKIVASFT